VPNYVPFSRACALALLLCAPPALAQPASAPDARDELLALLTEQTELATKTRLNADYVPGIIDILRGEELAARGARTVWDALGFVPGINPVMDQLGHRRVVVRGLGAIGDGWVSGYLKVLLNGVPVNTAERGLADPIFFIPIAQVERIEVIRGPGSALHGEHAVAGVVNVVTQEQSRLFLFGGSHGELGGGTVLDASGGDVRLSLNLGAWRSDGADVLTGPDMLHQRGLADASYAPGPANEGSVARNAIARAGYGGLSLLAQWTEAELGDHFGVNYALPPQHDRLVERSSMRMLEGRYRLQWSGGGLDLYAGDRDYRLRKDDLFAVPSEVFGVAGGPDVVVDVAYREQRRYWGADLSWQIGRHRLLLGAEQVEIRVKEASQPDNLGFDPATGSFQVLEEKIARPYSVPLGTTRRIDSLLLQDEIRISDDLSVTGGLRYDGYRGMENGLSPRLAAVWRFSEERVVKAQYGRAFRPPTLLETARGDPELRPVTIDTIELGYIRKLPLGEWRATLAHSELSDIIVFRPVAPFFVNADSARICSLELEGNRRVGARARLWAALAYTDTELDPRSEPFPGTSRWLGRLGARYALTPTLAAHAEYRHVSGFTRQTEDPREDAPGYDVVDLTLTAQPGGGLVVRAGIANLLDRDVRYPAFMTSVVSYPDDLPRPGRTWWLQVSKEY
jgi:outer membrane receptor for ferrienterochelin and colicins